MKKEYRIREVTNVPGDAEVGRYRDFGKVLYAHQRMTRPLYSRPLYKDPRAFLVILLIVLITILIAEAREKGKPDPVPTQRSMDSGANGEDVR